MARLVRLWWTCPLLMIIAYAFASDPSVARAKTTTKETPNSFDLGNNRTVFDKDLEDTTATGQKVFASETGPTADYQQQGDLYGQRGLKPQLGIGGSLEGSDERPTGGLVSSGSRDKATSEVTSKNDIRATGAPESSGKFEWPEGVSTEDILSVKLNGAVSQQRTATSSEATPRLESTAEVLSGPVGGWSTEKSVQLDEQKRKGAVKVPGTKDSNEIKSEPGDHQMLEPKGRSKKDPGGPKNDSATTDKETGGNRSSEATWTTPAEPSFINKSMPPLLPPSMDRFPILVKLTLRITCSEFEKQKENVSAVLVEVLGKEGSLRSQQINFLSCLTPNRTRQKRSESITSVYFYVSDFEGKYNKELTRNAGSRLEVIFKDNSGYFKDMLLNASLFLGTPKGQEALNAHSSLHNSGIIAGIAISVIAGFSLIVLFVMLLFLKHKMQPSRSMLPANLDAYTLDSFGDRGSRKRGRLSLRSFLNQAFEDPEMPSHPLSFNNLTSLINNKQALEEEFKKLPSPLPLLEEVPPGAESKNRFANVVPNPETRVKLSPLPNLPNSDYINANHVKGYGGRPKAYIATQAPLNETMADFWRMVWEQQSRTILMLTPLEENGTPRCAPYFPENTHDCHRVYGDFQVSLQSKDVRENFTVSIFRLLDLERNLFRDISHLWFTAWPSAKPLDDPGALMRFILEVKNHLHGNAGPIIVHCGPGTGRTGAVIAMDILMKEYDESRMVDAQRCATRVRQDRHGAINTFEQYALIHEVLQEYILKLGIQSQRSSLKSLMSLKLPSLS